MTASANNTARNFIGNVAAGVLIFLGDKTNSTIMEEIKASGQKLGAKSMAEIKNGTKEEVSGWKAYESETEFKALVEAAKPAAAPAPEPEAAKPEQQTADAAAPAADKPARHVRPKQPTLYERAMAAGALPTAADPKKLEGLEGEALAIAKAELEAQAKAAEESGKKSFRGTDWEKVLPNEPVAVRKGCKTHELFKFLCTEGGVTKAQMLEKTGLSAGGLAGVIHWDPKAKGYFLSTNKVDGVLRYRLQYKATHPDATKAGKDVMAADVAFYEPAAKVAKEPKAPKEPKAVAAPKPAKAAAVPAETAQITSRRAADNKAKAAKAASAPATV